MNIGWELLLSDIKRIITIISLGECVGESDLFYVCAKYKKRINKSEWPFHRKTVSLHGRLQHNLKVFKFILMFLDKAWCTLSTSTNYSGLFSDEAMQVCYLSTQLRLMAMWTALGSCVLPCQPLISIYRTTLAVHAFMGLPAAGESSHHVLYFQSGIEELSVGLLFGILTEKGTLISHELVSESEDL